MYLPRIQEHIPGTSLSKPCPNKNTTFPHQQEPTRFSPIKIVMKSSTAKYSLENLVEMFCTRYSTRFCSHEKAKSCSINLYSVCVCRHPIYGGRQICGRTRRGGHTGERSHRISHPPSFCGACLKFLSREGFSRPFPSSNQSFSTLVGLVFFCFCFFVRKNLSSCDCTEIQTHVPTSEGLEVTHMNHRGDRPCSYFTLYFTFVIYILL